VIVCEFIRFNQEEERFFLIEGVSSAKLYYFVNFICDCGVGSNRWFGLLALLGLIISFLVISRFLIPMVLAVDHQCCLL
jgi:hypothetical protein